jgi:hypothetical protein
MTFSSKFFNCYYVLFLIFIQSTLQQTRNPARTRSAPISLNNCPNGILVRKEYRDMSPAEWRTFRDALLTLQSAPSPDGGQYSEWDWFTRMHSDSGHAVHGYI